MATSDIITPLPNTKVIIDTLLVRSESNPRRMVENGLGESVVLGHVKVNTKDPLMDFLTKDLISTEFPALPRIIDNYTKLIGTELPDGDDKANHRLHAKKRQELFFHWIKENYTVSHGTDGLNLQDIICSGGLLAKLLSTPLRQNVKWDFHATNLGSSVLLWAESSGKRSRLDNSKPGVMFEALMTGSETGENLWDICQKKNWIIHRRRFNSFNILLLSDVDAIDENESWVEIKLYEEFLVNKFRRPFFKGMKKLTGIVLALIKNLINFKFLGHYDKTLNNWSQLVIGNAKQILLGVRKNHVLAEMETLSLSEFEEMTNLSQSDKNEALNFLNRLLQFVVVKQ